MTHIYRFAKYQLADSRRAVQTYYLVILVLTVFMVTATSANSPGENSLSGSIVFVFVLGLNCFKTSFLFSQANNLPRRSFYLATILAILALSVIMSLLDFGLDNVMKSLVPYKGIFEQIYRQAGFANVLWSAVVLVFSASAGWMITMMYYRANVPMKLFISLSPILVIWVMIRLDRLTGGKLWHSLVWFIVRALGLATEVPNPYQAVFSFSILVLGIWAMNYLLMYRIPIKA